MALDIGQRALEVGQNLGAEADHPGRAIGIAQGAEGDDELAEIVAGVENLHRSAERGLAVVDEQQVGIADVLQVELDDFVGGVDFAIAEVAAERIEQDEAAGETLLGAGAPILGGGRLRIHDRPAQIDGPDGSGHGQNVSTRACSSDVRRAGSFKIAGGRVMMRLMASAAAIGFDVYGTLVDPLGIGDELRRFVGADAERVAQLWRTTQLEYTWRRSLMGLYEPFSVCTAQALEFATRSLGHEIGAEAAATLLQAYRELPAFADAVQGLT